MQKENYSQLELFSHTKRYKQENARSSNSFLSYIWNYEKTILIIICFIITSLISFSLGVERGKRFTILRINSSLDMPDKIEPSESKSKAITSQYLPQSMTEKVPKTLVEISNQIPSRKRDQPHPLEVISDAIVNTQKQVPVEQRRVKDVSASQRYTIQVACYKTKTYAQKEAEALKKRGFSSLVLSNGSFKVVCVGNFSDQKAADFLLSKLKKQYRDCYLRRL